MKKIAVYLGLLVSLFCCVLILQNLDWKALWSALSQVHPIWLLTTLVLFYTAVYLRAVRWSLLFPKENPVAAHRLFKPTMIGFAFNNVLPSGRVGEFMRAIYVGKKEKTGIPVALGTIVTERVFDGVTIILLFVVSMTFISPIDPEMTVEFGGFRLHGNMLAPLMQKVIIGSSVLIGMLGLLMIPSVRRKLIQLLSILPLPDRIHHGIEHGLEDVIRGFHAIKHPGRFLLITFYSILIWVICSFAAQTLGWGFDGVSMTLMQAIALMVIESLAVMIPAAPGYWGLYEAGIIFGFAVLNLNPSKEIALAYGLVMHLIFFLPTTVLGLWFAGQASLKPPSSKTMASLENEQ
ncbi:MAG: lysylphosphatidylglycerol synthase transmembrane domain-containing protein [Verrucomicrobia bacterium]|jgi:glycosyltransferase 2 family protein|nr:lysylphosphatidylglycerol synthase transmembrane domain-containing protein [Verrucomicrobiota bacterium]